MFYRIAHFLLAGLIRLLYGLRVRGRAQVPRGGALICCNHSSALDPIIVALALKPADRPRFMAKIELFSVPGLKWLITALGAYPIERGKNDLGAIKTTLRHLKDGKKVLIFPEGTRMSEGDLSAAKQGAAMLALKSGVPLMPMYITNGRKPFINRISATFGEAFTITQAEGQSREELYAQTIERLAREVSSLKACSEKGAKLR